ncbi:hypothetical protein BH23GEM3_BH23GEM3_10420 [soil metagenome]
MGTPTPPAGADVAAVPNAWAAPAIEAYVRDIARAFGAPDGPLLSLVVFGSAMTGGYAAPISNVDLIVVLRDDADAATRERVRRGVAALEEYTSGVMRGRPPRSARCSTPWHRTL